MGESQRGYGMTPAPLSPSPSLYSPPIFWKWHMCACACELMSSTNLSVENLR